MTSLDPTQFQPSKSLALTPKLVLTFNSCVVALVSEERIFPPPTEQKTIPLSILDCTTVRFALTCAVSLPLLHGNAH